MAWVSRERSVASPLVPDDGGTRERNLRATRKRIADTALDLFQRQGYADTTIDQIAAAAGVGRRTIFRHFPTKEAILVDHLATGREVTLLRLAERPVDEPLLVSLHTVLRDLAESGYDRRLLAQIRTVLTTDPGVARDELSIGSFQVERKLTDALGGRAGETRSSLEIKAVTLMALSWFTTAAHVYLTEGRPSLLECFDEVVATCTRDIADWRPPA
jgi:AcrR family transcriptional regulator